MKVNDLQFENHPSGIGGEMAKVTFANGYGASVITGPMFYTSPGHPYEIAVLKDGSITYDTPLTDDVLGFLTEAEANEALASIEALSPTSGEPQQ